MSAGRSQAEKAEALRKLHKGGRILLMANAWDVASARVIEAAGFPAIATSSAGIAFSLGYADGEKISRGEMLAAVQRIARAVKLPVSADVEAGYGLTAEAAAETARGVIAAGAVGMNLEDSQNEAERGLIELEQQLARIRAARAAGAAAGVALVINARTDTFALKDLDGDAKLAEAIRRLNAYLDAGADCGFAPFVADVPTIAALAKGVNGPLNVLATPPAPPLAELERMGVARVSVGSALARVALAAARKTALDIRDRGSYAGLADSISFADMQKLMGG